MIIAYFFWEEEGKIDKKNPSVMQQKETQKE